MGLHIYNTQTQKKELFKPIHEKKVSMYVCGPTVYDLLHVGNFRGAIVFNLVRNWLEKKGFSVNYIYNYTDVDDKIIDRSRKEGLPAEEVADKYIEEFKKDYESLGLLPHSHNPRVTEFMRQILAFIEELILKGKAYVEGGDVYFDVHSFHQYGHLSRKKIEDLETGHRVAPGEKKRSVVDFALWKAAKPGEPSWPSPWGQGRPGWHIECSAMARSLLGDTIDIHGGGIDLVFPHHENEVAQSEGCTQKPFVNYWMHNNMINFGDQKMSKSLGNTRTARSFISQYSGEVLKFLMLSSHYRSTADFNKDQIELAIRGLARIYSALSHAYRLVADNSLIVESPSCLSPSFRKTIDEADKGIEEALNDDFNTPEVMARIYEVVRSYNHDNRSLGKVTPEKKITARIFYEWIREKGSIMALWQEEPVRFLILLDDLLLLEMKISRAEIDDLVSQRIKAREQKNWESSDRIRDELKAKGIAVQDSPSGTVWEVAK